MSSHRTDANTTHGWQPRWYPLETAEQRIAAASYDLTLRREPNGTRWGLDALEWRVFWTARSHGYNWRRGRVPVKKGETRILKDIGVTIHRFLPELPTGCAIIGEVSREDYTAMLTMQGLVHDG